MADLRGRKELGVDIWSECTCEDAQKAVELAFSGRADEVDIELSGRLPVHIAMCNNCQQKLIEMHLSWKKVKEMFKPRKV